MTDTTIVTCMYCGDTIEHPEYTPFPHTAHGLCIIEAGHAVDVAEAADNERDAWPTHEYNANGTVRPDPYWPHPEGDSE